MGCLNCVHEQKRWTFKDACGQGRPAAAPVRRVCLYREEQILVMRVCAFIQGGHHGICPARCALRERLDFRATDFRSKTSNHSGILPLGGGWAVEYIRSLLLLSFGDYLFIP